MVMEAAFFKVTPGKENKPQDSVALLRLASFFDAKFAGHGVPYGAPVVKARRARRYFSIHPRRFKDPIEGDGAIFGVVVESAALYF